jgi:hypothetical protein
VVEYQIAVSDLGRQRQATREPESLAGMGLVPCCEKAEDPKFPTPQTRRSQSLKSQPYQPYLRTGHPSTDVLGSSRYNQRVMRIPTHQELDRWNLDEDRTVAAKLRRDPAVLRVARRNLRRWVARDGRNVRRVFLEWTHILSRLSRVEIARFLRSDTPMARRLRQSSPFAGIVSSDLKRCERRRRQPRHETARV